MVPDSVVGGGRDTRCEPRRCALPVYHEAVVIRYESWVHMETQLVGANPVLSSSELNPGV